MNHLFRENLKKLLIFILVCMLSLGAFFCLYSHDNKYTARSVSDRNGITGLDSDTLNKGKAGICTMTLPPETALDGKMLKDLTLPQSSLVISILRGDNMMIPNGFTVIHSGDEVVAVCEGSSQKQLMKVLAARKKDS